MMSSFFSQNFFTKKFFTKVPHKIWQWRTLFMAACVLLIGVTPIKLQGQFIHPVKKLRVTSLFGESRGDHFHSGVDYATVQPILAIADGVVLFSTDTSENPGALNLGYGNLLVLGHKNNLRSHYLHLANGSVSQFVGEKLSVKKGEAVAYMGDSGFSVGAHLHLEIIDQKQEKVYNPLALLPKLEDNTPPQVAALLLKINEKIYKIRRRSVFKFFPESEMYIIAWDRFSPSRSGNTSKVGVHGIKILESWQDGKLLRRLDFSEMVVKDNQRLISSGHTFSDVYGLPYNFRMGNFSPLGVHHTFKIVAIDYNNNVSSEDYDIFFR